MRMKRLPSKTILFMRMCASRIEDGRQKAGRIVQQFTSKLIVAGMIAGSSPLAHPQPPDPAPQVASAPDSPSWWRGITTDGLLSLSYTYNENVPGNRINQFRVFDFNDDEPQLDMAQFVIQRSISEPKQFGFRFNLIAGSGVPEVTAAYGLFRNMRSGVAHHVDIPEFFVSYIVPIGKGLRLDLGKYATHMGYEVIGGYDGYNDNFSRGFIFGYAIPFTHTGLKATYAFNRKITAMAAICNGWDDVQRLNQAYTAAAQLAITPTKSSSLTLNFIHGPERRQDTRDQRTVYELVAIWRPIGRVTLGSDGVYGHEQNGVAVGHDAIWRGLAGYAKYSLTPRFSLAFRGEVFNDAGGTRTGTDQTLQGFTFTPEYDLNAKLSRLNSHFRKADGKFIVRGEVRWDLSDKKVFLVGNNPTEDRQFTRAVNLIYLF